MNCDLPRAGRKHCDLLGPGRWPWSPALVAGPGRKHCDLLMVMRIIRIATRGLQARGANRNDNANDSHSGVRGPPENGTRRALRSLTPYPSGGRREN